MFLFCVVVVVIGCGFLWFKHISLWFDAKSIDGFSHFTWVPKNIMDVCNCECDYIYSLFTSSRYWLASMTRCLFQRNENEKKEWRNKKKRADEKYTSTNATCLFCISNCTYMCGTTQHSTAHRTPYTVHHTVHASVHFARLLLLFFSFFSVIFFSLLSFFLYAIHIIRSFYNN